MLTRCGIGRLLLYDYDKVELANINRLFLYDFHFLYRLLYRHMVIETPPPPNRIIMQYITSDIILLHWMLISIDMNCISGSCCRALSAKYAEVPATVWTCLSLPGKFHVYHLFLLLSNVVAEFN
jgi:hypothetical protein